MAPLIYFFQVIENRLQSLFVQVVNGAAKMTVITAPLSFSAYPLPHHAEHETMLTRVPGNNAMKSNFALAYQPQVQFIPAIYSISRRVIIPPDQFSHRRFSRTASSITSIVLGSAPGNN